jgi:NAD(P)-dependent dehydrogenase (short-subunit alcohol dehydrogenase family)
LFVLIQDEKYVHLLVNNAGTMWCPKSYTKEGFEMHFGVNFLGHFYLTNQLMGLMKQASAARIINVSCKIYKIGEINFNDLNSSQSYNEKEAYNQSKLANVLFTLELSELLNGTNISVFTVDPGVVETDILRHSSYAKSNTSGYLVAPLLQTFSKPASKGAQNIVYCCVEPGLENSSGKFFR